MRIVLVGSLVLGVALAAGCADTHVLGTDGGNVGDARTTCLPTDPPPFSMECNYADSNHVCGDILATPECVDGAWQCPPGTSTAPCWCYGNALHGPDCTCTPSGWWCPDADAGPPDPGPLDAGAGCPADPTAAVGTACSVEGQTCGACTDRCSFCNLLACSAGQWQALEVFPDPACEGTFACGPSARCTLDFDYCMHTLSDIGGVPDDYRCVPFAGSCAVRDCACLMYPSGPGSACAGDPSTGVTVTLGGG